MVLLVICLIWAAALLPPFVRSRLEGNPADSVGRFRRHLRVLESTSPAASSLASDPVVLGQRSHANQMPKAWADEARRLRGLRRRREIARILLAAMGTTLILGLIPGLHAVLALHVVADLLFGGYVFLLVRTRNLEAERQMNAHFDTLRMEMSSDEQYTQQVTQTGAVH